MKKIFIFLACFSASQLISVAQSPDKTYKEVADLTFANLDKSFIKSKILYDRVLGTANLDEFSSNDTSSSIHFRQAHQELYDAHYNSSQHLTPDDLDKRIWQTMQYNTILIGALVCRFQTLNFNAVEMDGNNQYYLKNGFLNSDLYNTKDVNVIAILQPKVFKGVSYFSLYEDLIFANRNVEISYIQVNLGDGNPIQNIISGVEPITANYSTAGIKIINFTVFLNNGTQFSAKSKIEVVDSNNPLSFVADWKGKPLSKELLATSFPYNDGISRVDSARYEADIAFQGYEAGDLPIKGQADVLTYYAQGRTTLQNPLIFCDGFDPADTRNCWSLYSKELSYFDNNQTKQFLGNELRGNTPNNLYDVMIVNFPTFQTGCEFKTICVQEDPETGLCLKTKYSYICNTIDGGADYIERNAMVMVKILLDIKAKLQANGSTEKGILIGPSMGGLITRVALRYMEMNNMSPNIKLWVSLDSPQNGANIPIGFQLLVDYFANVLKNKAAMDGQKALSSIAARQQLLHHYLYYNNPGTADRKIVAGAPNFRAPFAQKLVDFGFPQSTCKNIAIANGSKNGNMSFSECNVATQITARLTGSTNVICKAVSIGLCFTGTFVGCLVGVALNTACQVGRDRILTANVRTSPANTDSCMVMQSYITNFGIGQIKKYVSGQGLNRTGLDVLPGGIYNVYSEIPSDTAFFYKVINNVIFNKASFIPTVSSLGLKNTNRNWSAPLNSIDVVNETNFSAVYAPNQNEDHVKLTQNNVNFLRNQILISSSCSGSGGNCPPIITQSLPLSTSQTLSASNGILASNQILNSNVNYKAGNYIILNPGFNVVASSSTVFKANIEGCSQDFWQASLVGNGTGTSSISGGTLTLTGNGNVASTNDGFTFYNTVRSGDVTIIARINSITQVDGMRAGIMIRSNLTSSSKCYEFILDGNGNVGKIKRRNQGDNANFVGFLASPVNGTWLKMVKTGNTITCYVKTDTNPTWNEVVGWDDHTDNDLGSSFNIGFNAYNSELPQTCNAIFDNITINGVGLN
jgi:hypothetical protein